MWPYTSTVVRIDSCRIIACRSSSDSPPSFNSSWKVCRVVCGFR